MLPCVPFVGCSLPRTVAACALSTRASSQLIASFLHKKSPALLRGWQERYVRLQSDYLCYYDPVKGQALCGAINLGVVSECKVSGKVFSVVAFDPKRNKLRSWDFRTATAGAASMWVEKINDACAKCKADNAADADAAGAKVPEAAPAVETAAPSVPAEAAPPVETAAPAAPAEAAPQEPAPNADQAPRASVPGASLPSGEEADGGEEKERRGSLRPMPRFSLQSPPESSVPEEEAHEEEAPVPMAPSEDVQEGSAIDDAGELQAALAVTVADAVSASSARAEAESDKYEEALKRIVAKAKAQEIDLSDTPASTGGAPSASDDAAARRGVVRSAAAERFARGLAQKDAAVNMAVQSAASRFMANARAKKEAPKPDTAKIVPLLEMLNDASGEPAAAAAAGGLANMAMAKPINAMYMAAKGTISSLAALLRTLLGSDAATNGLKRSAPVMACLSALAQDMDCKAALVHCGIAELLAATVCSSIAADVSNYAVVLAANLATSPEGREALDQSGAVRAVLSSFVSANTPVKQAGNMAAALANLAYSAEGKRACTSKAVLDKFATLLGDKSPDAAGAKVNVCRAMGNVAAAEVDNAEAMAKAGLVEPLVSAIKDAVAAGISANRALLCRAAQALTNIAGSESASAAAFEAGVTPPILEILKLGVKAEADVMEAVISLLVNLCQGHEERLTSDGVLEAITQLIIENKAPRGVKLASAKCLANLSTVIANRETLRGRELAPALSVLLQTGDMGMQAAVCMALAQLAKDSVLKGELDAVQASDAVNKALVAAKNIATPTAQSKSLLQTATIAMANLV